jgi:enoyl-CoA hydratase/carnithine racemase
VGTRARHGWHCAAARLGTRDVARELTYSGRIVHGDEAVRLGLATLGRSDPLTHARELARKIARSNPDAIRAAKRL